MSSLNVHIVKLITITIESGAALHSIIDYRHAQRLMTVLCLMVFLYLIANTSFLLFVRCWNFVADLNYG